MTAVTRKGRKVHILFQGVMTWCGRPTTQTTNDQPTCKSCIRDEKAASK